MINDKANKMTFYYKKVLMYLSKNYLSYGKSTCKNTYLQLQESIPLSCHVHLVALYVGVYVSASHFSPAVQIAKIPILP